MRHPVSMPDKREQEKQVVDLMVHLYCHRRHGMPKGQLCPDCKSLLSYAHLRSDKCPFMETKNFCSNCKVHCYRPEMREKIRKVMRFSGPRMLFIHPVMTIRHMVCSMKEKKIMKERKS